MAEMERHAFEGDGEACTRCEMKRDHRWHAPPLPTEAAMKIAQAVLDLENVLRTYTTMDGSFSIRLKQADFERVASAMGSTRLYGEIVIGGAITIESV